MGKCSSLDHIYPATTGQVLAGTRCYCGKRSWDPAPRGPQVPLIPRPSLQPPIPEVRVLEGVIIDKEIKP